MPANPTELVDRSPMSRFQWGIVAIMIGLNALDGFDVLSISFAAPGIARDWGIDRAVLGIVLSMELIGMAVGSIALGSLADRVGRRRTILACLPIMALGMIGASLSHGVVSLCACRVATGFGIGGMLAVTNAAVSEAASAARRSLCVVLMAAGYPLGAVIGGSISAVLLRHFAWPVVFQFGALVTLCFIPLVWWRVPESIAFELDRPRAGSLERINATLELMGHDRFDALPPAAIGLRRAPLAALFTNRFARLTGLLTLAFVAQLMSLYFILKWTPAIVADLGFDPSAAAGVLVWANVGGVTGSVIFGLLTTRLPLRAIASGTLGLSAMMIMVFGSGSDDLGTMSLMAAGAGFFANAGIVGLYALIALHFPSSVRAAATGFAIGLGRGGSALAPALAGGLFKAGASVQAVAVIMALGSVVAMLALFGLPNVRLTTRT